jgi:hypothetical protein
MMILSYALPSGEKFDWLSYDKAQIDFKYRSMNDTSNTPLISPSMALRKAQVLRSQTGVFPLLACSTTRHLVSEAFYTQNDFLILIASGNDTSHMKFPHGDVGKALRHVEIAIQCPEYGLDSFKLLAAGARRLPNLHTLELLIVGCNASLEELETVGPIRFSTKRLSVTYKHSTAVTASGKWALNSKELKVLEKLSMAGNKNVNENWVRYKPGSETERDCDWVAAATGPDPVLQG